MINYPIPISQNINNYYSVIEMIKKLEEKINRIEEEKNNYLKKDDNYYMI